MVLEMHRTMKFCQRTNSTMGATMASIRWLYPSYFPSSGVDHESEETRPIPLDVGLWSNLPQNVTDSLIKRLSLVERIPFRRVCKTWLEGSVSYFSDGVELESLPIMVGGRSLIVYNVRSNAWREKSMNDVYLNDAVKGLESSGGLVCGMTRHSENLIFVNNPLTNQTKYVEAPKTLKLTSGQTAKPWADHLKIQRPHYISDIALYYDGLTGLYKGIFGFVCEKDKGSYSIIMASTSSNSLRTTFVYDSLTESWSEGDRVPEEIKLWYGGDSRIVCNGCLYCLAKGLHAPEEYLECMLVKYDLSSGKWTTIPLPEDCEGDHPLLIEHRKDVVFISKEPETLKFYRLKELDRWNCWQFMKSMPSRLWMEFVARADQHLSRCVGKGNLIYLTGQKRRGSGIVALVFDPTLSVYKWLPDVKDDGPLISQQLRCYEPSLQPV